MDLSCTGNCGRRKHLKEVAIFSGHLTRLPLNKKAAISQKIFSDTFSWMNNFNPRPVLAFGYCRCLRLCVCLCLSVCKSLACPRDNSGPVQARITKFEPKMQNTLVKVPIVLWTDRPWPWRSNLTWKSKFTPFWTCPHHNSPSIQVRITKFGPEV